jgi:hypothetical protein
VLFAVPQVCNHPDLFEGRPIISSFDQPALTLALPSLAARALDDGPWAGPLAWAPRLWDRDADLATLPLMPAYAAAMGMWDADEMLRLALAPEDIMQDSLGTQNQLVDAGLAHLKRFAVGVAGGAAHFNKCVVTEN